MIRYWVLAIFTLLIIVSIPILLHIYFPHAFFPIEKNDWKSLHNSYAIKSSEIISLNGTATGGTHIEFKNGKSIDIAVEYHDAYKELIGK